MNLDTPSQYRSCRKEKFKWVFATNNILKSKEMQNQKIGTYIFSFVDGELTADMSELLALNGILAKKKMEIGLFF